MVSDLHLVEIINRKLHEEYQVLDGRPIYKLVWSDDQLELRMGTFTDWCGSILIRQEHKCLREVKKYWYFKAPAWVLEKLIFMPHERDLKDLLEELVQSRNGTYEPVYVFMDKSGNALPVSFPVIETVLNALHNPTKMTESDYAKVYEEEEGKELRYFEEEIGKDERSPLFIFENSAFVSTNQVKFRQTYTEKSSPIALD